MVCARPRKRGQRGTQWKGEFEIIASVVIATRQVNVIVKTILESRVIPPLDLPGPRCKETASCCGRIQAVSA